MQLTRKMLSMRSGSYNMHTSVFKSGEFFPEHYHDFHEFFLVASGTLEHTLNGKVSVLSTGTVQLIHPGDNHIVACAKECQQVVIYNCNVNSEEMLKILYFITAGYDFPLEDCTQTVKIQQELQWRHLLSTAQEILKITDETLAIKNSLFRLLTQEIITILMKHSLQERTRPPQWLEESVLEMKKKINYKTGLPRFIELSARSQEHLCRSMRKFYGISPQEYVISLRLDDAANQLLHSKKEVTEIAFDSGFGNLSYFRRCFLKKYAATPLKYRNKFQIMTH